ncbi:MAG: hypothetical protein ACXWVG_20870 [Telluria sp.]
MAFLRIALLLEVVLMAAAVSSVRALADWDTVPIEEIRAMPHGIFSIYALERSYSFFSGAYAGMAVLLGVMAFVQRREIMQGTRSLKTWWGLVLSLPLLVFAVTAGIEPL